MSWILSMLASLLVTSNCKLARLQSSESREFKNNCSGEIGLFKTAGEQLENKTAAGVDDEDDTIKAWTSTSGRR